ncbi:MULTISPECIES: hypothetical protein [unclassified Streptomyces]|uniref:hypothetical protein n=1 Tax=unclassified Streptomyces TaxID=2593676 RepID=UPI001CB74BE6|nr:MULTISPECIES: hypothetical protein [unclassified Streptomyces]MBD0707103.1 hypothetical protein [Streptomyces sp. CBMA291]MBD0714260.1 hypothetical protein [Streptomyces sp. CBMA370]
MTEPTRYSTPPVELPLHLIPDPLPVEDCAGCVELASVRDRARAGGDMTTVTDCNVFLRRHPEGH